MIVMIGFLLAACSQKDSHSESKNATSSSQSAKTSQTTSNDSGEDNADNDKSDKYAKKQVLNINITTEPPTLNPGSVSDTTSAAVLKALFEGLTRIQPNGEPAPAQAKSIKVSEDQLTYTVTLRDDIYWSNGDPVTSQDFVYEWKWMLNPENFAPKSFRLFIIENGKKIKRGKLPMKKVGLEIIDKKTFKIHLKQPVPYFKSLLAMPTFYPVNAEISKNHPKWYTDAGKYFVSNGPFVLAEWQHKNEIILKQNLNYWDKASVHLQKIQMVMINEANTELLMFKDNQLDWVGDPLGTLPLAAIPTLKKKGELTTFPIAGKNYITLNTHKKPFTNAKIRKAFALAIDREAIVQNITQGGEVASTAFVPSAMWPENKEGYFHFNPEKAQKLLKQGMKELGINELPSITYSYNTGDIYKQIAVALQAMWKENLGVKVKLDNSEWKVYLDTIRQRDYQMGRMGGIAEFNDPYYFFSIWKTTGNNNFTHWHSDKYAQLLEKSSTQMNPDKRKATLKKAEQIFMDAMPIIPLYYPAVTYNKKDYVKDVYVSKLGSIDFKWAYIAKH